MGTFSENMGKHGEFIMKKMMQHVIKCAFDKVSMRIHLISKFHDV